MNPNLMHSDHFHYVADKQLFAFLRRRENLQYLERNRLRFYFGCEGTIEFVPAQCCRMSPHRRERKWITVSTMAFDTGRVYLKFQNFRERVAENFAALLPLVVTNYDQLERHAEKEPMGLLRSMPEGREQIRIPTKFYAVVLEHQRERELQRRARRQELR